MLDREKINLCRKQNVKIIEIPELETMLKIEQLKEHLISECVRLKIKIPKYVQNLKIDLGKAYIGKN